MRPSLILAPALLAAALSACGPLSSTGTAPTPVESAVTAVAEPTAAPTLTLMPEATEAPTDSASAPTTTSEPDVTPAEPTVTPTATSEPSVTPAEPTVTPAATDVQATAAPTTGAPPVELQPLVGGLEQPLYLTDAGDGSGRLFVVEQAGMVKIIRDGQVLPEPFLDIRDRVGSSGNEQGLLSIAFHPRYAENGLFYADYTDKDGDTVVSRFSAAGDRADPASEAVVLTVDQPYPNHNGGLLKFGPDGYLYVGLGDGGSAGDPQDRAQDPESLLGKLLRIDIDSAEPYAIPADNPFTGGAGRPEIWALGLRNPWRFAFDRQTGDLYIGDVGQNKYEEISFQPAGQGGLNYGWKPLEGSHCYVDGCDPGAYSAPIAEYPHEQGCSVTGGYVYRGVAYPQLQGLYLYGDYCSGTIWSLQRDGDAWRNTELLTTDARITSFGENQFGELYVIDRAGTVYRLTEGS